MNRSAAVEVYKLYCRVAHLFSENCDEPLMLYLYLLFKGIKEISCNWRCWNLPKVHFCQPKEEYEP